MYIMYFIYTLINFFIIAKIDSLVFESINFIDFKISIKFFIINLVKSDTFLAPVAFITKYNVSTNSLNSSSLSELSQFFKVLSIFLLALLISFTCKNLGPYTNQDKASCCIIPISLLFTITKSSS